MRDNIEDIIRQQIMLAFDDLDIESYYSKGRLEEIIQHEIDNFIKDEIAMKIRDKVLLTYRRNERLIDSFVDAKVNALLYELGVK